MYEGKYDPPKVATDGSAGLDLFNNSDEKIIILPQKETVVKTGVRVEIPKGHVGLLCIRSSFGFNRYAMLGNSVGIIDSDYRGEIMAKVFNRSAAYNPIEIEPGERFCQLVVVPYYKNFVQVNELSDTERGEGGIGSTGRI